MKNKSKISVAILAATFLALMLSPVVYAKDPGIHVLVKAEKLHADTWLPDGEGGFFHFVDDIIVEVKADGQVSSIAATGSIHGISCHATFFVDFLNGAIVGGILTLNGEITDANSAYHGAFKQMWVGAPVELSLNLLTNEMDVVVAGMIDFSGIGRAVQN